MSYTFQISYDGSTYSDYTNNVIRDSIEYSDRLHTDLRPNSNFATLEVVLDNTLKAHLINSDSPVFFKLLRDGTQLLEGIISPVFDITNSRTGAQPAKLKLEDYTNYKLKKRFTSNISWTSYYVCNPSSTSTSIIHQVLSLAGVTASSYPTIAVQIPAVVIDTNDKTTYFDFLSDLLFEFGYMFYYGLDGRICFYNFADCPSSLSSITNELRAEYGVDGNNILDTMTTASARGSYDSIKLTWYKKSLETDLLLSEQSDYVSVPAASYYPSLGSNSSMLTEYSNPNYDIIGAVSATLTYDAIGMSLSQALINYGKKALFTLYNPNGYACNAKHTIKGSAWVKSDKGITNNDIRENPATIFEYECKYLYDETRARALSTILKNYYAFSKQGYEVTSKDYFPLGSYVKVVNVTNDNFYGYGRIKQIDYNKKGSYTYHIESITEYVNTDTSTSTENKSPNTSIITKHALQDGSIAANLESVEAHSATLTNASIDATSLTGSVGCLTATQNAVYTGSSGTYNNPNTYFYVDSSNRFSLGTKLLFDGTTLTVNGDGTFSGDLSAATGTFAGALSGGTISIGSGDSIFKADSNGIYLGNATFASAPFRVTPAGAMTATNATITGTISSSTITGGTIAIGSSNNIFKADSNGIYLGNATFASAPFRVTPAGALTATGATISGAITATTITANGGGTVAGWITDSDSFKSAASGARIQLTKSLNRLSIYSSTDEEVVVGYISGKRKNGKEWDATKAYAVGDLASRSGEVYKCTVSNTNHQPPNTSYWSVSTDTWGTSDRGIWVNPASTCQIDGIVESKNGSLIATDGSLKVKRGSTELIRIGTVNGFDGMTMFNNNGANPVIISNNNFSGTTIDSAGIDVICYNGSTLSGYISYGIETTDNHVTHNAFLGSTTQKLTIHDALTVDTSATISNNLNVGLTSTLGTKMQLNGGNVALDTASTKLAIPTLSPTSYSGIYALITQDTGGTVTVKKQLVPDAVWSFSCNQDVSTSGAPTFASVSANAFWENGSRLLSASGTAAAATKLQTARRITAGGDCTGYVDFDGSADVTIPIQVSTDSHYHTAATISGAQSGNTPNSIVMRGASGEFGAGSVTTTGLTVNGAVQVNGNIGCTGTVDGVDVAALSTTVSSISTTVTADLNQAVKTTSSPIFAGLTVNGVITSTGKISVPVGFTYFQLPGEAAPSTMFNGTWKYFGQDSTLPSLLGIFPRFEGGNAAAFQVSLTISTATTTSITFTTAHGCSVGDCIRISTGEWRQITVVDSTTQVTFGTAFSTVPTGTIYYAQRGTFQGHGHASAKSLVARDDGGSRALSTGSVFEYTQEYVTTATDIGYGTPQVSAETRPLNMTIRVWKRIS